LGNFFHELLDSIWHLSLDLTKKGSLFHVNGRLNFKLLLETSLMTRKHSPRFEVHLMNSSLKTIILEKKKDLNNSNRFEFKSKVFIARPEINS
jgi:hypothetical protein